MREKHPARNVVADRNAVGLGHHRHLRILDHVAAVLDDGRERRAAGIAVHKAGEDLRRVGLLARRRPDVFARRAAIQKALELVQINFLARRDALDRHADGRGMRLAEDGQMQIFAVGAAHKPSPFKLLNPPKAG